MNKEFWNKLPSEEKTKAIRHFLKSQDLIDFDYDKVKAQYKKITSELGDKAWCYFLSFRKSYVRTYEHCPSSFILSLFIFVY